MTRSSIYNINKGMIIQKTGKKNSIYDSEKCTLYTLNESASYIFHLLKKGFTLNSISDKMAKKYKISRNKALKDASEAISDLKKKKIIG